MLPQKHRLRDKRIIGKILSRSIRSVHGQYCFVKMLPARGIFDRFAFVVSKKNIPKAHDRNYVKRVFREIVREIVCTKDDLHRFEVMVFIKKESAGKDFSLLKSDILQILHKAGYHRKTE